jgi:hypothetical protein
VITSGAGIGGMGVHPAQSAVQRHIDREAAQIRDGLSIVTGMTMSATEVAAPSRASKIAAIHALAYWLAENPDMPIPDGIEAYVYLGDDKEADEQTRMAAFASIAGKLGDPVSKSERMHQIKHPLFSTEHNGIAITYKVCGFRDRNYRDGA